MGDDEAYDVAGGAEGNPCEAVVCERKVRHDVVEGGDLEACGVDAVVEGRDQSEEGSAGIDSSVAVEKFIREGEDHEGDRQRIEEHQDRNSGMDDGGQAEECNAEGSECEDGHPDFVREDRNQTAEVFSACGDEADACG